MTRSSKTPVLAVLGGFEGGMYIHPSVRVGVSHPHRLASLVTSVRLVLYSRR